MVPQEMDEKGRYRDWFSKTLESECDAIKCISKFLKVKKNSIRHVTLQNGCSGYDLEIGNTTIDVKYSHLTRNKNTLVWDFDLRGKRSYCTHLFLIGYDFCGNIMSVFFVPMSDITNVRHIRINPSGVSKWYKYSIWRYDIRDIWRNV